MYQYTERLGPLEQTKGVINQPTPSISNRFLPKPCAHYPSHSNPHSQPSPPFHFPLRQENRTPNHSNHHPNSTRLYHRSRRRTRILRPATSRRTIRQRPVNQNRTGAIDIRNLDQAQIQRLVAAVSNNFGQVRRVRVVIAAAFLVLGAETGDGLGLVDTGVTVVAGGDGGRGVGAVGDVAKGVGVRVGVGVRAVDPEAGEDGEGADAEEDGGDA